MVPLGMADLSLVATKARAAVGAARIFSNQMSAARSSLL